MARRLTSLRRGTLNPVLIPNMSKLGAQGIHNPDYWRLNVGRNLVQKSLAKEAGGADEVLEEVGTSQCPKTANHTESKAIIDHLVDRFFGTAHMRGIPGR